MTTRLEPRLQTIADKVSALTKLTHESGFSTKRTIRELLTPLTPDELVAVSNALYGAQTAQPSTR